MSQQSIHDQIMSRNRAANPAPVNPDDGPRKGRRSWTHVILFTLLGLVVIGIVGFTALQLPAVRNGIAQSAAAKKAPGPALPDTPFLAHVKQAGLSTCSNVFPILGQILTDGAKYNVQSEWNEKEPDKHPVQALVGLDYQSKNYTGPAAGLVFASPNGSACEGAMVRVAPLPISCQNVPATLPQGSKLTNSLGKVSVYTLANNGGQALLLPSGEACIVMSVAWAAAQ